MPRWPVILFGIALYWSAPWVIATLFILGACMMWFGFSRTYRHAIPLLLVFGALTYFAFGRANAQSYIINQPGQLPTMMNDMGGGTYTINPPGQLPTIMTPMGGGGYMVNTPGQLPTIITPMTPPLLPQQPFPQIGR